MTDKLRPVIPVNLVMPLQRYATAHNLSVTAVVALLLTQKLKQEKYIK